MTTTPRLAPRLKQATLATHRAVERLPIMVRLMSPQVAPRDYLDYLLAMAEVYATLETPLLEALGPERRQELGIVPRLPAILQDLARLGVDDQASRSVGPRPFGTSAAVGGIYVLEGSTLGGRVIARHLRRCLGAGLGSTSFLDFHGERASEVWKGFTSGLDRLTAPGRLDADEAVAGAVTAFHCVLETLRAEPERRRAGVLGGACAGAPDAPI
jgi:heme oxygenase